MTYADGQAREMAKWAHQRLDAARQRAEEEQRRAVADVAEESPRGRT